MPVTKQEALEYHQGGRPGKVEVISSKPCRTQRDLSVAYTPGVAVPCFEIEKNPLDAYRYTSKGKPVAVVSNGTAVLGLGDIGALAGKPVMEGKGAFFKPSLTLTCLTLNSTGMTPTKSSRRASCLAHFWRHQS
jgi:malate dehydrogenase (oxaloacetate-decarboxylating)(NADP+)